MPYPLSQIPAAAQAAFWASYAAWIGSEMWILSRDRRPASGEPGDRGSRRLIGTAIAVGAAAAFSTARLARIAAPPALLAWSGVGLMLAGMALRLWAVATLGRFFRTSVLVLDDHQLVTSGPYRLIRNPSYTGALITLLGIGVAIGGWVSLALVVAIPLAGFVHRIRIEDEALRRRFGDAYEAYRRRTSALVPFLW